MCLKKPPILNLNTCGNISHMIYDARTDSVEQILRTADNVEQILLNTARETNQRTKYSLEILR